jgi:hypothetical protein
MHPLVITKTCHPIPEIKRHGKKKVKKIACEVIFTDHVISYAVEVPVLYLVGGRAYTK